MKKTIILVFTVVSLLGLISAEDYFSNPYYERTDFMQTSAGARGVGLYGYANPANLTYLNGFDMMFAWSDKYGDPNAFKHWGLFAAIPGLSFNTIYHRNSEYDKSVYDYQLSSSFGTRTFSLGTGYRWSSGNRSFFGRKKYFVAGMQYRPVKYLSVGLTGNFYTKGKSREAILDLALRPLGTSAVSLFGDVVWNEPMEDADELNFSLGAALEPVEGLELMGRYYNLGKDLNGETIENFSFGISLSYGRASAAAKSVINSDGDQEASYGYVRLGDYTGNLNKVMPFIEEKFYVKYSLKGSIKYQNYVFFDQGNRLINILTAIEDAKENPMVGGMVINISGLNTGLMNMEKLWEVRKHLEEFKKSGKKIVIYADFLEMNGYQFASVADRLVLDPMGEIMLNGYGYARTYFKGTLDMLGIGVDEWRFFKYKSAMESYSRKDMSEGDREQMERLFESLYEIFGDQVSDSRNITESDIEDIINNEVIFLPKKAKERNLVTDIGSWSEISDIVKNMEGEKKDLVPPFVAHEMGGDIPISAELWGAKPKIAVIYALGVCAMDTGINARKLSQVVKKAGENNNIKAIVLRVDSPGGSALASDLVAREVRKAKEKKPVIISQGTLAASGGYWLSMDGDRIFAGANTLTGSIGVIGGWFYDDGFKSKIGFTTDHVQIGKHGDLGTGMRMPIFGFSLPDRNLTSEEREMMTDTILELYDDFLQKVADGRGVEKDKIAEAAQGRIWTGEDGLTRNLVDELGTLYDAVEYAKSETEITDDRYEIVEYPEPQLFSPNMFKPKLVSLTVASILGMQDIKSAEEQYLEYLQFRIKHNGRALPMVPVEESIVNPAEMESSY